ncbi:g8354 [Coccomyxa viridis]|uniref:G8354 protein n=1 Tax=Coccomyxa viridis TaxID=1274662 RepID=A0ABP1G4Z2_9CHLO
MQLPKSSFEWSVDLNDGMDAWVMRRIRSTCELTVRRYSADSCRSRVLELDVQRQIVKALCRASQTLDYLSKLNLHIEEANGGSYAEADLQCWTLALLVKSTKLELLSVYTDGIPWLPVLGLLHIRHLELIMKDVKPWLDVILTDLSLCSCLETLKIADERVDNNYHSKRLPDLLLREVATLKSVELVGWYPKQEVTLPQGHGPGEFP